MIRHTRTGLVLLLVALTATTGCSPSQPFYLHESGDMRHYLDHATSMAEPDVDAAGLPDAHDSRAPLTIKNAEFAEKWNLRLEEAVAIALHNSKVIRSLGGVTTGPTTFNGPDPDGLLARPESSTTIYDPAAHESSNGSQFAHEATGPEAALAAFDAEFFSNLSYSMIDRPQNSTALFAATNPRQLQEEDLQFETGIKKRAATGTEFSIQNKTTYEVSNRGGREFPTDWFTSLEVQAKHPFLRGGGTQVNRIPVVLARIRTDVSLADFEASIRNLVNDVEQAYWDLTTAYRVLDANRLGRDGALRNYQIQERIRASENQPRGSAAADSPDHIAQVNYQQPGGGGSNEDVERAKEQYFFFRGEMEKAESDLFRKENRLRWLLGLAATDGRLVCPIDEPTTAPVVFNWTEILCEGILRTAEIRKQKWQIERAELELIAARNALLPKLDLTGLYRWQGLGQDLIATSGRAPDGSTDPKFLQPHSTAAETLLSGDYQEASVRLEFSMPIGFRSELAGVRHAQINVARERARLEDMELNVAHLLSQTIRDLDLNLQTAQTQFNRWKAAQTQIEILDKKRENLDTKSYLEQWLNAQRNLVQAQIEYFRALADYNKSIAFVHFRKGSLLEYNNVCLAEGPWPAKAYWDAVGLARQRDASSYLNYGWSRPHVISRGDVETGESASYSGQSEETAPVYERGEHVPTPQPTPAHQGEKGSVKQGRSSGGRSSGTGSIASKSRSAAATVQAASRTRSGVSQASDAVESDEPGQLAPIFSISDQPSDIESSGNEPDPHHATRSASRSAARR